MKQNPAPLPELDGGLAQSIASGSLATYLTTFGEGRNLRNLATEKLREFSRKQILDLCSLIEKTTVSAIEQLHEVLSTHDPDDQNLIDEALLTLRGAALLSFDVLQEHHSQPPDALLNASSLLHDHCILAIGDCPAVQDAVAKLCCSWWELQVQGKEAVVAQTLPYILMRANASGKPADVKSCYTMRDAFGLLDFDDPSISDVKTLMLRAAFSPAFIQRFEGRRFLAFLFGLQPQLVRELMTIVRNQIPSGRKAVLDAYGEIIFRAWRDATGPCLLEVETSCIQNLMQACISASTPALAVALRQVLQSLHSQKRVSGVDAMLLRLYEPIIFRAFEAANAAVRRNALLLLLDAFPLTNPESTPEEMDEVLSQQFGHIRNCLGDECPLVRMAAVEGVCNLLNHYWEIIPASTTALLVSKLTGELAFDMSWPAVRVKVLEGLSLLIDNPHAQPVLKKALPQLACLLNDPVVKVRESMASLLVSISSSRSLHFYDVVPLDMLLDVMGHDVASVSSRVQRILLPSYFPNPEEGSARICMLLKANPLAGRAFCQYLISGFTDAAFSLDDETGSQGAGFRASVPIEHIMQLAGDLKSHLLATCAALPFQDEELGQQPGGRKKTKVGKNSRASSKKKATGKRRKAAADVKQEGEASLVEGGAAEDPVAEPDAELVDEDGETPESWASIAAGLAELCVGLAAAVNTEAVTEDQISDAFEHDALLLMYEASPSMEARESVLRMVRSLPFMPASAAVRTCLFSELADGRLVQQMQQGAAGMKTDLTMVLQCLCSSPTTGTKLVAMLLRALGLRPVSVIHMPVAAQEKTKKGKANDKRRQSIAQQESSEDEICCEACGAAQPDNNLLLCDGCDMAFHTTCLKPILHDVPEGDWFCHCCETDLQSCAMGKKEGLTCLGLMLSIPDGRDLLYTHHHLEPLLQGLRGQAHEQEQLLLTQLQTQAPSQAVAEVRGSKRSKSKAANVKPAIDPCSSSAAAADQGPSTVGLYCRTALHLALTSALATSEDGEDEAAAIGNAAGSGGKAPREQALLGATVALNEAVEMCEQVLDACVDSDCAGALTRGLEFVGAVLKVLCDAQHLSILDLRSSSDQVTRTCMLGDKVVSTALKLAATHDGGPADKSALDVVSCVLLLIKQLATGLCKSGVEMTHGSGAEAGEGILSDRGAAKDDEGAQPRQLEPVAEGTSKALVWSALDSNLSQLLLKLMSPTAATLLGAIKPQLASVVAIMLGSHAHGNSSSQEWLKALTRVVGQAFAQCPEQDWVIHMSAENQEADKDSGADAEKDSGADAEILHPNVDHNDEPQQQAAAGSKAVTARSNNSKAQAVSLPTASAVLAEVDPSAALMSTVLMGVVSRSKQQDTMFHFLASAADDGWRQMNSGCADAYEMSLGAVSLMAMMDVRDIHSQQLRMNGSEASALIKMGMLLEEIQKASSSDGSSSVPDMLIKQKQLAESIERIMS